MLDYLPGEPPGTTLQSTNRGGASPGGLNPRSAHLLERADASLRSRELQAAFDAFRRAERAGADPDRCAAGRWEALMLRGDLAGAWREADSIRARGAPDPHRFWQGEPIDGKRVIVRSLHGLGDAVQFFRYLPRLRERVAELTVEVPPPLLELAPYFAGDCRFISWGDKAPAVAPIWEVQIEVVELPYLFRTTLDELPVATGYLQLPGRRTRRREEPLQVGVVWESGEWNRSRSVPLEALGPIFETPGCEFWNLQGGAARREWPTGGGRAALRTDEGCANSLAALARQIASMDVVVTPDTLAAHLAGAQGVAASVMLEHAADWRWMHERPDSPWYPAMRLFRQPTPGDWAAVVAQVAEGLYRLQGGM